MEKSINISWTPSFSTQFWGSQLVFIRSRFGLIICGVLVGFPILALVVIPMKHPEWLSDPTNWIGALVMVAIPLVFLPLCNAFAIWQARRRNAWLRGVMKFAISTQAFKVHGEGLDVRLRWDVFHKVIETSGFFLLYVGPVMAHIIPKDCVTSPTDLDNVRAIVHDALGRKARLQVA